MDYSNLVYFPKQKVKIERDCGVNYSTIFLSKEIAQQMSYSYKKEFREGEKIVLCESKECSYDCQGEKVFSTESESGLVSICNFKENISKKKS